MSKRKIIKQANQAYTITLPIEWVRSNKLSEKSELDVNISGKSLVISTDNPTAGAKVILNLEENDSNRTLYQSLNALYARGVDEIEIISSRDISQVLTGASNNLLGFALVARDKNKYIIKEISGGNYSEFEEVFKRVFQMILLFYEDAVKDILGKRTQTDEGLKARDLEVNKFSLYLQRAINKKFYQDSIDGRIIFTYAIALEEIGDEIMRLWRTIMENKIKKTKELEELLDLCRKMLDDSFDSYYQFNITRLKQLYSNRNNIREKILKMKGLDGKTAMILKHILKIAEEAADLSHLNLMLKLK